MSRILDLIERLFDPIIPNYCVDMSGEILDDLDVLVEQLPIDSRESAISKSLTFYKNVSNFK